MGNELRSGHGDSLGLRHRSLPREGDGQDTIIHRRLDVLWLLLQAKIKLCALTNVKCQSRHTLIPSGTGNERAKRPNRRSRMTKPFSCFSDSSLDSPETVSTLFRRSIFTSCLLIPGSSNVALTRFLSLSSWTSTLHAGLVFAS